MSDPKQKASGSSTRKRTELVQVRVTPEEKAALADRAAGAGFGSPADYIRVRCLKGKPLQPRLDVRQVAAATAAFNRIGGNVNQIARAANRGRIEDEDIREVRASMEACYQILDALRSRL